ncbi:MAG: TetR/AcrR family transcriptional regulator [Rhodobacteraceae bacterium]|nr:TetR/AcrR family transcriptional regulator [Paracoccaceae bacterium]
MTRARPYDRDKALDAALNLFWQKGYHATSLKDLEAALAMKPGSIYAAFKSKESLFLASLERYYLNGRDQLHHALASAPTVLGGLAAHLRSFGSIGPAPDTARACMIVKTILDSTDAEPAIRDRARAYYDRMRADFAAYYRKAIDAGELPQGADPDRLAQRYQADLTALRIEAHNSTDPASVADLADAMAREIERPAADLPAR